MIAAAGAAIALCCRAISPLKASLSSFFAARAHLCLCSRHAVSMSTQEGYERMQCCQLVNMRVQQLDDRSGKTARWPP